MTDIKLYRPQRLSDNPDGGGLATSTQIVDGEVNNLFDDVSRIDRVNGDVSLRAVFGVADTADTEVFAGLHWIVAAPPGDPRVQACLLKKTGWADERQDAQNSIERFLDPSVPTRMLPYDRQLAGQRTVLLYQRPELPLPDIGEAYVLTNEAGDQQEFVRVQAVESRVEKFFDTVRLQEFEARVITVTITQPLAMEWPGSQPNIQFARATNASLFRETSVSDAARYYGTLPLAVDADAGDLTIKLGTIFGQLVPAAVSESAVTDAPAGGAVALISSAAAPVTYTAVRTYATATPGPYGIPLPTAMQIGSRTITITSLVYPNFTFVEQADGSFEQTAGLSEILAVSGDAARLTLDVLNVPPEGTQFTASIVGIPAVQVSQQALSYNQPVTLGTRGSVYVTTLSPIPAPGSLSVSYQAGARWYVLQDDGTGALRAPAGIGVGQINYATGTVSVTLGALPDVGSSLIYAWAQQSTYQIRTQSIAGQVAEVELQLAANNCEPGSLQIEWAAGGVARTAADDGAGNLTGDATGRVVYSTGAVALRPTLLPDSDASFEVDYEGDPVETEVYNPDKSGATITITAAEAPVRPRSVLITYSQTRQQGPLLTSLSQQLTDSPTSGSAGVLVDAAGNIKAGSSINYTTGEITFNPDFTVVQPLLTYGDFDQGLPARTADPTTGYFASTAQFGLWPVGCASGESEVGFVTGSAVTLQYKQDSAADTARSESFAGPPLRVRLTRGTLNTVVPGSLLLELGGAVYVDRGGRLARDPSTVTGAATDAGTLNYTTGVAELVYWPGGVAPAFNVRSLLTQVRALPLNVATGRTPGSPIRPGSFLLQANRYRDGALLTGVADQNGNISTTAMHGYVDAVTGVWSVAFGRWVLDSALTADEKLEPWYSIDAINEDGYIWQPDEAVPGSVRFSCVVQSSLPLDPSIIGVNPVRLPQDGRVQFIRAGDTLVIHDTQAETLTNPVVAGTTYTLPRGNLASLVLYAANGLGVDPEQYTVNLTTGAVTMADPLDLTGYTQPLVALHTVEDMALCTDAQIDGSVTLAQPLSRGYSADNALVSSALVSGDVSARVANVFAQQTWLNAWTDTPGTPPTSGAQYNDVTYPIEVVNADAITMRWRIQFTSASAFNVVAEELGILTTGTTGADVAPINPATGEPYFTIRAAGWGTGWATGNLLRFNTVAAGDKVWVLRCVQPGAATLADDRIRLQARYDRD